MATNNPSQPDVSYPVELPQDSSNSETTNTEKTNTITLPRSVVYFQAAFLGVIATTFFIFGLMVGSLTSNNGFEPEIVSCEVSGEIVYEKNGVEYQDSGAVVMMISNTDRPTERLNPTSIHPDSFVPLENDVITTIHKLGGAIVRADDKGRFNIFVDSPAKYELIVISKNKADGESLSKRQMAALSSYFRPVENLTANKAVHVSSLKVNAKQKEVPKIKL